jgi:hypothetical protein
MLSPDCSDCVDCAELSDDAFDEAFAAASLLALVVGAEFCGTDSPVSATAAAPALADVAAAETERVPRAGAPDAVITAPVPPRNGTATTIATAKPVAKKTERFNTCVPPYNVAPSPKDWCLMPSYAH